MARRRATRNDAGRSRLALACVAGLALGAGVTTTEPWRWTPVTATSEPPPVAVGTSTTSTTSTTTTTTTTAPPEPVFVEVAPGLVDVDEARRRAQAIRDVGFYRPSGCGVAWGNPNHLPNAPREYRTGVHQGVDYYCAEPGHQAIASLPGRVVTATHGYQEPERAERDALLAVAAELGRTPESLLWMLWGRHVVVDHGVVDGAGHVVTVYTHLHDIDEAVRPGAEVHAGQRIGEIGLSGTSAAAAGRDDPAEIHLHWEIHVDDRYLGEGLSSEETVEVYRILDL